MVRLLAAAAVAAGAAAPAAAGEIVDPSNHFRLELGAGWSADQSAEPGETLLVARHGSGSAVAVLTRSNHPNLPAWRTQAHYFDDVVAGLRAATAGFKLVSRRQGRVGTSRKVPFLDVTYRRRHPSAPHVATRFLFYRTFTLILAVASDAARRRSAAAVAQSLAPD